jgi:predicted nuclease with TOPRIM domain
MEHARAYRWPLYCVECRGELPADSDDTMCAQCVAQFRKTCVDCGESVNREHKRCRACHELRQERIAKWQEAKDLEREADRLEEMAKKNSDQVEAMRQRRNAAGFRERAAGAMARREELIAHIKVDRYGKDR